MVNLARSTFPFIPVARERGNQSTNRSGIGRREYHKRSLPFNWRTTKLFFSPYKFGLQKRVHSHLNVLEKTWWTSLIIIIASVSGEQLSFMIIIMRRFYKQQWENKPVAFHARLGFPSRELLACSYEYKPHNCRMVVDLLLLSPISIQSPVLPRSFARWEKKN